jgi:hypothetical protein
MKNNDQISIINGFYRNIFDQFLLKLLIDKIMVDFNRPKVMNIGSDICENRGDFYIKLAPYYSKINMINYEQNNKDKIAKIQISNKKMKNYFNIHDSKFNYEYFINKITNN